MTLMRTRTEIAPTVRTPTEGRDLLMKFLIVFAWGFSVVPRAIQTLTAPKYRVNIGGQAIPYSGLAHKSVTIVTGVLFLICLLAIVLSIREIRTNGKIALVAFLLPWFYMVFRSLYQGHHVHRAQYVYPLVGIAIWALRPKFKSLALMGYLAGGTALLAVFMGLVMPAKGIAQAAGGTDITADKQIFSSGILVGPFTNGNNLGQFLVMGAVCCGLIKNRYWRVVMIAACGLGLLWSSARSTLLTFVLVGIVVVLIRLVPLKGRGLVAFSFLAAMVAVVVELPLITTDPTAYSNRGYIWRISLQFWAQHKWTGLGANFYQQIAANSSNLGGSVYHGHNEFVQLMVTGGRWLTILVGFLMVVAVINAGRWARRGEHFPFLFLTAFIGACVLEVSFALIDRDFLVAVMVVPLAFVMFAEPPPIREMEGELTELARMKPAPLPATNRSRTARRPAMAGTPTVSTLRTSSQRGAAV